MIWGRGGLYLLDQLYGFETRWAIFTPNILQRSQWESWFDRDHNFKSFVDFIFNLALAVIECITESQGT